MTTALRATNRSTDEKLKLVIANAESRKRHKNSAKIEVTIAPDDEEDSDYNPPTDDSDGSEEDKSELSDNDNSEEDDSEISNNENSEDDDSSNEQVGIVVTVATT